MVTEGRAAPLTREQWLAECCKLAKVYEDNMTKALDEIERKALALLNEVARERGSTHDSELLDRGFVEGEALCRAIEQHEAFRQEVSDAVENLFAPGCFLEGGSLYATLSRFIIAKPDPLVEAVKDCQFASLYAIEDYVAKKLRAAIEKRGGKIVWGEG